MSFHRIFSNSLLVKGTTRVLSQPFCLPRTIRCAVRVTDQSRRISLCVCHHAEKDSNVNIGSKAAKIDTDDELDQPVRYSTSKAEGWSVDHSFGKHKKQRPVWKVCLLSGSLLIFLGWVFFRKETEIDKMLDKDLYQTLEAKYPNYVAPGKR